MGQWVRDAQNIIVSHDLYRLRGSWGSTAWKWGSLFTSQFSLLFLFLYLFVGIFFICLLDNEWKENFNSIWFFIEQNWKKRYPQNLGKIYGTNKLVRKSGRRVDENFIGFKFVFYFIFATFFPLVLHFHFLYSFLRTKQPVIIVMITVLGIQLLN